MPDPLFGPVARIERELDRLLPPAGATPSRLHRAMRYSLFAGGKRLRPVLAVHAFRACGGRSDRIWPAAAALEMVHAYSLIHDDLPAMDDDDLRRGQPTVHRKFDEATAILAGDALLTLAFGVVAERLPAGLSASVSGELSLASGTSGMIGGQALDLAGEGRRPSVARVEEIHRLKTAALITAAVRIGALAARARRERLAALTRYGRSLGLAFQIVDDILDETGDAKALGKPVRRDRENGKMTYPCAAGLEKARSEASRLARAARSSLRGFGPAADPLRGLADFVHRRTF